MNTLQETFDQMANGWMKQRAESQMTLGRLIERLSAMNPETQIELSAPHSYRGYYSDLSLKPGTSQNARELLAECRKALNKTFYGYKGGDFEMHSEVPVWIAYKGSCGKKLIAVNDDGSLDTEDDD